MPLETQGSIDYPLDTPDISGQDVQSDLRDVNRGAVVASPPGVDGRQRRGSAWGRGSAGISHESDSSLERVPLDDGLDNLNGATHGSSQSAEAILTETAPKQRTTVNRDSNGVSGTGTEALGQNTGGQDSNSSDGMGGDEHGFFAGASKETDGKSPKLAPVAIVPEVEIVLEKPAATTEQSETMQLADALEMEKEAVEPTASEVAPQISKWRAAAEQRFANEEDRTPWGGQDSEMEGLRMIEVSEKPGGTPHELEILAIEDDVLRKVFGKVDYLDILESGLFSRFEVDPERGRNAILHILAGEKLDVGDDVVVAGLHHAPAAETVWSAMSDDGEGQPLRITLVTDGLEDTYPLEPYRVIRMEVDDTPKARLKIVDGVPTANFIETSMFPKAWSPREVLEAITTALDNSNPDNDVAFELAGKTEKIGKVLLGDGESEMAIKIVIRNNSQRIIAAWPLLDETSPMWLRSEQVMDTILSGAGIIRV